LGGGYLHVIIRKQVKQKRKTILIMVLNIKSLKRYTNYPVPGVSMDL